jgi:hypothetical protein
VCDRIPPTVQHEIAWQRQGADSTKGLSLRIG